MNCIVLAKELAKVLDDEPPFANLKSYHFVVMHMICSISHEISKLQITIESDISIIVMWNFVDLKGQSRIHNTVSEKNYL